MGNIQRKQIKLPLNWNRDCPLDIKDSTYNTIRYEGTFLGLFIEICFQQRLLLDMRGMHNIFRLVTKCINIEGDIADVGIYREDRARVIYEVKGGKSLHLFDFFGVRLKLMIQ